MWTSKMHAPGIRLQEHSKSYAAQDARFFALLCAFSRLCCPQLILKTIGQCKMNNGRGRDTAIPPNATVHYIGRKIVEEV
jgi:hypothetical protein